MLTTQVSTSESLPFPMHCVDQHDRKQTDDLPTVVNRRTVPELSVNVCRIVWGSVRNSMKHVCETVQGTSVEQYGYGGG